MSTLIISELHTISSTQEIRIQNDADIYAIRLGLYKHNTPTGTLTVELTDENDTVLKSVVTNATTINSAVNNTYGYGLFRFTFNTPLRKTGTYTTYKIKVKTSTSDTSNYYAWLKNWEFGYTDLFGENQTSGVAEADIYKPFYFEIETYKNN